MLIKEKIKFLFLKGVREKIKVNLTVSVIRDQFKTLFNGNIYKT